MRRCKADSGRSDGTGPAKVKIPGLECEPCAANCTRQKDTKRKETFGAGVRRAGKRSVILTAVKRDLPLSLNSICLHMYHMTLFNL